MRKVAVLFTLLAGCAPAAPKFKVELPELHAKVDNGIRMIVLPDHTTDLVQVDVRYEVGGNEDPEGKAGLAHLVEHMAFQLRPAGPDKPPVFDVVREVAVDMNAYTHWDKTHYHTLVKKKDLDLIMAIESQRLQVDCDAAKAQGKQVFDPAQFEREREVVRNEIRQRMGTPDGQLLYKVLELAFPPGHPYRRMIGGDDAQIASAQLEDVCKFMKDYYVPERTTFVIAGNVTQKEVTDLAAKWLKGIPARKPAARKEVKSVAFEKKKYDVEFAVDEPQVIVGWALPPDYTDDGRLVRFALNRILGYINQKGQEYEFATEVAPGVLGGSYGAGFFVMVTLRDASKVDDALSFIKKSTENASRGWEDDREFENDRRRILADFIQMFESLGGRTEAFAELAQYDPNGKYFAGEIQHIKDIRAGKIRSVAQRVLSWDNAMVIVVKPKAGGEGSYKRAKVKFDKGKTEEQAFWGVDPKEARRPLPFPQVASLVAKARRFTLGNGMRVVLLPAASQLPVMNAQLVFNVGSAHEPPEMAGLASLTAGALSPTFDEEFTNADEVDAIVRMDQAGVSFGGMADTDHTMFFAAGINIYLEQMARGVEALMRIGDYSQEGIENRVKRLRYAMKKKSAQDEVSFMRAIKGALFGPDHPYTVTGDPTTASASKWGRDAALSFKKRHYSAKNATLIVTGNFDEAAVEKQLRSTFGSWAAGHEDKPVAPAALPRSTPVHFGVIAQEESPSIQAVMAYPAPAGIDGQHAARLVLAQMLNLRMGAVREELGASYGVYARYAPHIGPGMYQFGGALDAERAPEALAAMRAGVDRLRKGEKFDEDFVKARRLVLHELVSTATESLEMANQLAMIARYNLPPDFYDKLVKQVAALAPAQVHALLQSELRPELEVVALLGSKAKLEKAFKGANITDAQYLKSEAK